MAPNATQHAEARIQQRGVRFPALALLLQSHDTILHAGAGCVSVAISREAASELIADGHAPGVVEAAKKLVAIVDEDTGAVVTVMHDHGLNGARYRRQFETRKQRSARYFATAA